MISAAIRASFTHQSITSLGLYFSLANALLISLRTIAAALRKRAPLSKSGSICRIEPLMMGKDCLLGVRGRQSVVLVLLLAA
jgi:hypothetical protein